MLNKSIIRRSSFNVKQDLDSFCLKINLVCKGCSDYNPFQGQILFNNGVR